MKMPRWVISAGVLVLAAWMVEAANNIDSTTVLTGQAAFADSVSLKPGIARKITPADLPKPYATESARVQPWSRGPKAPCPSRPQASRLSFS